MNLVAIVKKMLKLAWTHWRRTKTCQMTRAIGAVCILDDWETTVKTIKIAGQDIRLVLTETISNQVRLVALNWL